MGVVERYRQFCRLTIKLTGIHATLMDVRKGRFACLPEEKIRNLAEWIEYAAPERQINRKQIDFSLFGDITEGVFKPGYSIDTLKLLFQAIRRGDKESARKELAEIEESLYAKLGTDYNAMRWQGIELFIRMSRAAIKGGAEQSEVVEFCIERRRSA